MTNFDTMHFAEADGRAFALLFLRKSLSERDLKLILLLLLFVFLILQFIICVLNICILD